MAANTPIMEFKKGDSLTHYFQLPAESWNPGGTLYFAAKGVIDNDNADSSAVIDKAFHDTDIVLTGEDEYLAGWVTYRLGFIPTDIVNVNFQDGEKKRTYLGEFEYVSSLAVRESFPANDDFINVIIYADVRRGGV